MPTLIESLESCPEVLSTNDWVRPAAESCEAMIQEGFDPAGGRACGKRTVKCAHGHDTDFCEEHLIETKPGEPRVCPDCYLEPAA